MAGQRPSALGAYLGVTEEDLTTKPKTDIPSETVRNIIDLWIGREGKKACLEKLLHAMDNIGRQGELKEKLDKGGGSCEGLRGQMQDTRCPFFHTWV